jgi:hypothetical protein
MKLAFASVKYNSLYFIFMFYELYICSCIGLSLPTIATSYFVLTNSLASVAIKKILPSCQITSYSIFLGDSKYLKFDQIYIINNNIYDTK